MKNILVTYATTKEFVELTWVYAQVAYLKTGIGKTKSAYFVSDFIDKMNPDGVLNIGTAGTLKHQIGDIFVCRHFIDRDMKKLADYGVNYEIKFPTIQLEELPKCLQTHEGTCNTGDTFLTSEDDIVGDVIDMEAYAQAFVCQAKNIPFVSVKCITDIIGQNSVDVWENGINKASKALYRFLNGKEKE